MSVVFRGKGASPTNHCWCQSSRVIALPCGIKISAVHHLILSQSTRVTDRQTDGQTDTITTPKTALAYTRAVKTTDEHKKSENICRVDEGGPVVAAICGEKDLWERCMHRHAAKASGEMGGPRDYIRR